jgi:hypothetical protein
MEIVANEDGVAVITVSRKEIADSFLRLSAVSQLPGFFAFIAAYTTVLEYAPQFMADFVAAVHIEADKLIEAALTPEQLEMLQKSREAAEKSRNLSAPTLVQ